MKSLGWSHFPRASLGTSLPSISERGPAQNPLFTMLLTSPIYNNSEHFFVQSRGGLSSGLGASIGLGERFAVFGI